MGKITFALAFILLLAVPFAAARTFYITDDGTVIDPEAGPEHGSQVVVSTGADEWETLNMLRQRNSDRYQYGGGDVSDYATQQEQDDWTEQYLLDRYRRGRSDEPIYDDSDWRQPIRSWEDWWDYRYGGYNRQPYYSSYYPYSSGYGRQWVATDYYYRNRYINYDPNTPYNSYRYDPYYDRNYQDCSYNARYYGRCGYYGSYSNDTYRPFDWYYLRDGKYYECNGDDFKQYDCSYRWDGAHYYYALGPDDWYYYDRFYHLGETDISDRFALVNGRYVFCPRRGFDHDECVYYYKNGGFYYDDPSDNTFWDDNVEWDTDLDDPQSAAAFNAMAATEQNSASQPAPTPNSPAAYAAYYSQYSQFNFANGQFVSCTSGCHYYQGADGRMYGMTVR